jgi:signal transduction histidine kinase
VRRVDETEEKLLRSVALQNARAVLLAREQAERELISAKEALSEARDLLEKRVQERTSELETANEKLRKLSASLLKIRDEEQIRIARELHDSEGQLLAAIGMNIGVVQEEAYKLSPTAAKCTSENAGLVEEVISEIRTISHLLHPPLLDEAGLADAVRWYAEGFGQRSNIKVELAIPSDFGRLPNDTEIAIFRIIQECLTNIHRHSGSTTAAIHMHKEGEHVVVQVKDSGRGISKEKLRELTILGRAGVGFGGMRERLGQLGGSLEIQSNGEGTSIRATVKVG